MTEAERAFEQVLEIAQEQVRATTSLVEIERQNATKLDAILAVASAQTTAMTAIAASLVNMDRMRDVAVADVKAHTSLEQARSERSWRFMVWLATGLIAASNVVSALLVRWGKP